MNVPQNDLEQRGLDKVNQGEGWLKTHWQWLVAIAAVLAIGFLLGKIV